MFLFQLNQQYGNFHAAFGRPGHGAPLRTDSGKLKTELKNDMDIRFMKTDKGILCTLFNFKIKPSKALFWYDIDYRIVIYF